MCTSSLLPRQNHRVFLLGPHVTMCTVKPIKLEFSLLTKKRLPKTCSSGTTWRRKVWELWFGGCSCHNFSRRLISWGLSFSKATLAVYALHFPGKNTGKYVGVQAADEGGYSSAGGSQMTSSVRGSAISKLKHSMAKNSKLIFCPRVICC